jgi:hypothetical protein
VIILGPGLPDFSWHNTPKRDTYTKIPQNIPNGNKMCCVNGRKIDHQMATKYTNIFHCKALQNLPKLGLMIENMPSCNPA